jgi:ABC-type microcin C transport system permease subunit YejB
VNISSAASLQYLFSVPYGVGKTAIDRMTVDMGTGRFKIIINNITIQNLDHLMLLVFLYGRVLFEQN